MSELSSNLSEPIIKYDERNRLFKHLFIYVASENGHLDTVKYLIENRAYINEKDRNGKTALIWGKQ